MYVTILSVYSETLVSMSGLATPIKRMSSMNSASNLCASSRYAVWMDHSDASGSPTLVAKPDMLTRVSEYTDKIVTYIQQIINRGYAYASNGSVYFDVPSFENAPNHKYAKLNKAALENVELAMDGEGALAADASEKRAENDFVLWKKSKPGEPAWDSPWGMGRPGWHIECSAMC